MLGRERHPEKAIEVIGGLSRYSRLSAIDLQLSRGVAYLLKEALGHPEMRLGLLEALSRRSEVFFRRTWVMHKR